MAVKSRAGRRDSAELTHAAAPALAESAKEAVLAQFPDVECEIHFLTPAFITQGGPGCVAIQSVKLL